jgi:hypothetical protein
LEPAVEFETVAAYISATNWGEMVDAETTPMLPTVDIVDPDSHTTATIDFDNIIALRTQN